LVPITKKKGEEKRKFQREEGKKEKKEKNLPKHLHKVTKFRKKKEKGGAENRWSNVSAKKRNRKEEVINT